MTPLDDEQEAIFITLNLETKIIRIVENTLIPSRLNIRADVSPREDITDVQLTHSMQKIKFWYEHIVSKSLAFDIGNDAAIGMIFDETGKNRSTNMIMFTPGDPTDELLAALFQSKMSALSNGMINFGLCEVKSDNHLGLAFTFVGEGTKVLPPMKEWIGERSYFEKPWWERNDSSTLDVIPGMDADLTKPPAWAYSLDNIGQPPASPVVVRPSFNPTVIPGGKPKE